METLKFKTNIKCEGCLSKATPHLNEAFGEENWEVDIKNPLKPLTVKGDGISAGEVKNAVEKAGYNAEDLG